VTERVVSINQPAYLPWLGYFDRIVRSDLHVVLDHVQLEKNSFTNRNRILAASGPTWLTIPVRTTGRFGSLPICDVEISDDRWRRKHWLTMRQAYGKSTAFSEHAPFFETFYASEWTHLLPAIDASTRYLLDAIGVTTPLVRSSELASRARKDMLVLEICQEVGATTYLSGPLGRDYLREELFDDAGIEVRYHDYAHPVYEQAVPGFEPFMAVIDLLFNAGPRTREIIAGEAA